MSNDISLYKVSGRGYKPVTEVSTMHPLLRKAIKERFGFKKVKGIMGYYSDGEDAYYMLLPAEEWRGS